MGRSNDAANKHLNRVQVIPLTSQVAKVYPSEALVTFAGKQGSGGGCALTWASFRAIGGDRFSKCDCPGSPKSDRSEFGVVRLRPQLIVVDKLCLRLSLVVPVQFYQFPNHNIRLLIDASAILLYNHYIVEKLLLAWTMAGFEILGEIRDIETIAASQGVYIRRYLERTYGRGRWRKMKGLATVQLADGSICEAEIH